MYKKIEGFSRYEITDTGLVRQRGETPDQHKDILAEKDGKFLLLADDATLKTRHSKDELFKLAGLENRSSSEKKVEPKKAAPTPVKKEAPKAKALKAEKKPKEENKYDKAAADKIVKLEGTKKSKMKPLQELGCSNKQITSLLDTNIGNVNNTLNGVYERFYAKKAKGEPKAPKKVESKPKPQPKAKSLAKAKKTPNKEVKKAIKKK